MASPKTGEKRGLTPSELQLATSDKKARSNSPSADDSPKDGPSEPCKPVAAASHGQKNLSKSERKLRKKMVNIEPCSHDDVFWQEVIGILGQDTVDNAINEGLDFTSPLGFREELEVTISQLSSNGDGLALAPVPWRPWVVVVPFSLPGERVWVRIFRHARLHSYADFVRVVAPNTDMRDMSRVQCKYFGKCGGCQYQMLSYDTQLSIKRDVVVKAYKLFSKLPEISVPPALPTAPSPLQYGYRTKITPHFDAPIKMARRQRNKGLSSPKALPQGVTVPIGFNIEGKREVMDIEECPIATPVINKALGPIRENIISKLHTYKKGVNLLLRDSLPVPSKKTPEPISPSKTVEEHICVTDQRGKARERVGDMLFEYGANSFFQNNNSVLVPLVEYVREAIFPKSIGPSSDNSQPLTHLVDAYCGAGLFSIMLSPYFSKIAGIELSAESIAAATKNAQLNNLPEGKVTFREGDAARIFLSVPEFPPASTALIIDPPRKGCDENFLDQLLRFRSAIVVYVSCNVHTQARDVGILLKKSTDEVARGEQKRKYVLESIRGFDLFPQTAHVESVAVLRLV